MEFCPTCDNLLLLNQNKETNVLEQVCSNCSYAQPYDFQKGNCIMTKHYNQNQFLSKKYTENPYIYLDKTLPRNYQIPCRNPACITHQNADSIRKVVVMNIPYEKLTEVIAVLHEMLTPFDDTYEIRDAAIHVPVTYDRIHLDYTLTKLSKEEVTEQLEERLSSISTTLKITNYPKPINEIVYIKYDTINMKYVYICSNCQFSWRNDE